MLINQLEPATVILIDQAYGRFTPGIRNQVTVKPRTYAPMLGEEVLAVKLEIAVIVAEGFQLAVRSEFGQPGGSFHRSFGSIRNIAGGVIAGDLVRRQDIIDDIAQSSGRILANGGQAIFTLAQPTGFAVKTQARVAIQTGMGIEAAGGDPVGFSRPRPDGS